MKKITPEEEIRILENFLSGKNRDELFDLYSEPIAWEVRKTLHRHCDPKTVREQDIEDFKNDVVVKLLDDECRRLRCYDQKQCKLRNWIRMIAQRSVLNTLRKNGYGEMSRNKDRISIDDDEIAWTKLGLGSEEYKTMENIISIKDALEKLPDIERLVLKLEINHGLEISDIASHIHKKPGATSTIKSRAIARLREIIQKC